MNKSDILKMGRRLATNNLALDLYKAVGPAVHRAKRLYVEINTRCNLRCLHCDKWAMKTPAGALSSRDWLSLIETAENCLGPYYLSDNHPEQCQQPEPLRSQAADGDRYGKNGQ